LTERMLAPPYVLSADEAVTSAGSNADSGLTRAEAARRLSIYGQNEIPAEHQPSVWAVAAQQLRDPMNIMLVAVVVVSILIGQVSTGVIVALLILLNLGLGTRQELMTHSPGGSVGLSPSRRGSCRRRGREMPR
jgi:Ca2+-transporting ATPase